MTDLYEILHLDIGANREEITGSSAERMEGELPLANPSNATPPDEPYEKRTNSWKDLMKDYQLLKQLILDAKLWYGEFQEGYKDIETISQMEEREAFLRFFCLYEAASEASLDQTEKWQEIREKLDQLDASDPYALGSEYGKSPSHSFRGNVGNESIISRYCLRFSSCWDWRGGFSGSAGGEAYVTPEGVVVVGAAEGEVEGVLPWVASVGDGDSNEGTGSNPPEKIVFDPLFNEFYYIRGNDLLRVKPSGEFVSVYPGANSSRVINVLGGK